MNRPSRLPKHDVLAQVVLNLQDKDDAQVLDLAQTHSAAMTGNATFTTPDPLAPAFLTRVQAFAAGITAASAAQAAAATAVSAKDDLRALLEGDLKLRQAYVQKTSDGDETKILSAGFQVKAPTTPIGNLLAPENLRASFGDMTGEVDLMWDRVRGARSYVIDVKEAIAGSTWAQAKMSTKSRVTIDGLTPGKTYVFRVRALGAAGEGPFSDEATKMAP